MDELAGALGEESALARLHTIHNVPQSITITVDVDPLRDGQQYRVSWHWRSVDQVIRGSGGMNGLTTFDQVRAVAEGAYGAFAHAMEPEDWRRHIKVHLDAVRAAEASSPKPRATQLSLGT